jgi:glucose/arabinose dehydrogenase
VGLQKVATGLPAPMMIAVPPDGSGRMVVVDQAGTARVLSGTGLAPEPFIDLRDRMAPLSTLYDERGFYSLAFHPDFRNNGRLFVFYSAPLRAGAPAGWSCTNRLSEFRVMPDDPGRVDMASEKILLAVDKPQMNHNGGPVLFGPDDGRLYLALGDGGGAGDTGTGHTPLTGNAQDMTTFHGKILRIDVDRAGRDGKPYAIPPDNPFAGQPGILPEIYASGLRNPAYLAFDSGPGHRLIAAVAGQKLFEPVFVVTKGGNYGWNIREGTRCFNPADNTAPAAGPCAVTGSRGEPLIGPIIELGHDLGTVVVGGFVYRGTALPGMTGKYVFGDWSSAFLPPGNGVLLVASPPDGTDLGMYPDTVGNITPESNRMWTTQRVRIATSSDGEVGAFVRGFGEDGDHEIYLLTGATAGPDPTGTSGTVWKIVPA